MFLFVSQVPHPIVKKVRSPKSQAIPVLCYTVTVVSDSLIPWTLAYQAPLSMGILQARILEWVAMPSSRGSFQPRD